jgi:hypothetical protein
MTTGDQVYSSPDGDIADLVGALESARAGQSLALATAASGQERAEAAEAALAETRDRLAKAELRLAAVEAAARSADPWAMSVRAERLLEITGGEDGTRVVERLIREAVLTERRRIRDLAVEHGAVCTAGPPGPASFADLIREPVS